MELQKALLSVVVPVYDSENFVAATIESVLAQTYPAIEIIMIDDGSTDHSRQVCERFSHHRNVTLICQANAGVCAARNVGLHLARGEYIAFLDCDDVWHPQKAARHCAVLDERADVDLTSSGWLHIDETGKTTGEQKDPRPEPSFEALLVTNFTGTPSCVICRRSAVLAAGGWDQALRPQTWTDHDMWIRIAALREGNMVYIPEVLTAYRRRAGQMSADLRDMERGWKALRSKIEANWPDRFAVVKDEADAMIDFYLAHLAMEAGEFRSALRLIRRFWPKAPRKFRRSKYALRVTSAILAGQIAPKTIAAAARREYSTYARLKRPLDWSSSS